MCESETWFKIFTHWSQSLLRHRYDPYAPQDTVHFCLNSTQWCLTVINNVSLTSNWSHGLMITNACLSYELAYLTDILSSTLKCRGDPTRASNSAISPFCWPMESSNWRIKVQSYPIWLFFCVSQFPVYCLWLPYVLIFFSHYFPFLKFGNLEESGS